MELNRMVSLDAWYLLPFTSQNLYDNNSSIFQSFAIIMHNAIMFPVVLLFSAGFLRFVAHLGTGMSLLCWECWELRRASPPWGKICSFPRIFNLSSWFLTSDKFLWLISAKKLKSTNFFSERKKKKHFVEMTFEGTKTVTPCSFTGILVIRITSLGRRRW